MTTRYVLLGLVSVVVVLAWLFLGLFQDREFGKLCLFVKHRPSLQIYFRSPVGEGDTPPGGLSSADRRAEDSFHEFVEVNGGYWRQIVLFRS